MKIFVDLSVVTASTCAREGRFAPSDSLSSIFPKIGNDSAASTDSVVEAGAPEVEIEITPKMIADGVDALSEYVIWDAPKAEIVEAIFRAMRKSI